jgi:hypothetical protein
VRLLCLLALALTAALVGCGDDKDEGPRRLEQVFAGKDSSGDDLTPEEMAAQGDRIWFTESTDVASIDARSGKPATPPQEVGSERPILYDIAGGYVWSSANFEFPRRARQ